MSISEKIPYYREGMDLVSSVASKINTRNLCWSIGKITNVANTVFTVSFWWGSQTAPDEVELMEIKKNQ